MPIPASFSRLLRAGIVCLCVLALGACDEPVYSGLTETGANEMLVVLANTGIRTDKEPEGKELWRLVVDSRNLSRALDVLAANGLPHASYPSLGEIFKKEGMVSTPTEERARLVYAISQELAGTIAAIDGVLNARVHLVLPEQDSFGNKTSPSKASVFIKHRSDVDLSDHLANIKRLVENSVQDLRYESISVFLFPSVLPLPLPPPPETTVLGVAVAPAYAPLAWGIVACLCVLAAACAVFGVRRLRGGRKHPEIDAQS
jgi:type III secretion protein J